jgi:hypothetical protein
LPQIEKIFTLHISPERFVNACDETEFMELQLEVERRLRRELTKEKYDEFKNNLKIEK